MKIRRQKRTNNGVYTALYVIAGIALNFVLSFACNRLSLPLWFDTAGTIAVSALCGVFAGMFTAVGTSMLCTVFNLYSIYYTLIGVLIVLLTSTYATALRTGKKRNPLIYLISLSLIGGVLGSVFQMILLGDSQFQEIRETAIYLSDLTGAPYLLCVIAVGVGVNCVDKSISAGLAWLILKILPEDISRAAWESGWKQKPLTGPQLDSLRQRRGRSRHSMQKKISIMMGTIVTVLTLTLSLIFFNMYYERKKGEYTENAQKAASFAAAVVDPEMVSDYIKKGREAEGYAETEELLYHIRDSIQGVMYLYVIRIKDDGCYVAFDLDNEGNPGFKPGEKMEFEEAFEEYKPALFAGQEIPTVESDDISGWLITAYEPVRDKNGKTVCYAAADVSMSFLSHYATIFLVRMLLVFSGFLIIIIGYGLWAAKYSIVYPIASMTYVTNGIISGDDDQKSLDKKVKDIRALGICTGDETEELYFAISKMATGMAEQMRELRYYSEATSQMQNGLIITMANMVEDRDSDTGAHIQKTAAYVRIIAEGLKRKGYYLHKLTPKYMSDIVMSAPLHDVGKISIPDAVLNKPGKLTEEEYEIMKTHTIAGKKIMENAISSVQGESYLKEARNMAAYHHERWDGKGYPEGLHGEVIPLSARIMAVADVFDALSSPRIYKPAFPLDKALNILNEGSGTQFDPKCIEVFMESLAEVKQVLKKYQEG